MAIAYREQFAAVIDRSGGQMNALIPNLRQKLGERPGDTTTIGAQAQEGRP